MSEFDQSSDEPTHEPTHEQPSPQLGEEPLQLTGHPQVDEALRSLETLPDRPVAEHVEVFEAAHALLREALSDAAQQSAQQSA